ncbi:hypothetical protein [Variovorax sp. RA8]|uniref:hypothetical protein n=1 Tax=Variovorax sp. (strain JCM 16519 / RA8) TaxID=662548 RepID=UPI000AB69867|nr:hypothetical protein [Variovorax sp. RA8]VTU44915.1 hypothetical protein RA8P2_00351 [Variovorax sp. RA8]
MDYNALLKRFYTALLEAANPELMGAVHTFRADGVIGLDDIFLPGVSDGYGEAPLKVMVIGRERHYRYRAPRAEAPAANARPALSIREYVEHGMRRHEEVRTEIFVKDAHDSDLLGLLVSVAKAIKTEESPLGAGVVYANLFAVAFKGGDPRKTEAWPHIRDLSKALLDIQIDVLKPDVIVFANGIDSAPQRKLFFPHTPKKRSKGGEVVRCTNGVSWKATHGIEAGHLYGFKLDERIQCYRIHHPSSPSHRAKAAAARVVLLKLLKETLATRTAAFAQPASQEQ